jgi:hypothetical protein
VCPEFHGRAVGCRSRFYRVNHVSWRPVFVPTLWDRSWSAWMRIVRQGRAEQVTVWDDVTGLPGALGGSGVTEVGSAAAGGRAREDEIR